MEKGYDKEELLRFECQFCAEAEEKDGKIICGRDGETKEKTDTCKLWWSSN